MSFVNVIPLSSPFPNSVAGAVRPGFSAEKISLFEKKKEKKKRKKEKKKNLISFLFSWVEGTIAMTVIIVICSR